MASVLATKYEVLIGTGPDDPAPSFVLSLTYRTKEGARAAARHLLEGVSEGTVDVTIPTGSNVFVREVQATMSSDATSFEAAIPDIRAAGLSINLYLKLSNDATVLFASLPPKALISVFETFGR